jgi:hypothetical protein
LGLCSFCRGLNRKRAIGARLRAKTRGKIPGGTRSVRGRAARDAFPSRMKTQAIPCYVDGRSSRATAARASPAWCRGQKAGDTIKARNFPASAGSTAGLRFKAGAQPRRGRCHLRAAFNPALFVVRRPLMGSKIRSPSGFARWRLTVKSR